MLTKNKSFSLTLKIILYTYPGRLNNLNKSIHGQKVKNFVAELETYFPAGALKLLQRTTYFCHHRKQFSNYKHSKKRI